MCLGGYCCRDVAVWLCVCHVLCPNDWVDHHATFTRQVAQPFWFSRTKCEPDSLTRSPHWRRQILGTRYSHSCVPAFGEYIRTSVWRHVSDRWTSCASKLLGTGRLRSVSSLQLNVPRTHRRTVGDRAFVAAGPTLWNSLPHDITDCVSLTSFCRKLKTFWFSILFPWLQSSF